MLCRVAGIRVEQQTPNFFTANYIHNNKDQILINTAPTETEHSLDYNNKSRIQDCDFRTHFNACYRKQ